MRRLLPVFVLALLALAVALVLRGRPPGGRPGPTVEVEVEVEVAAPAAAAPGPALAASAETPTAGGRDARVAAAPRDAAAAARGRLRVRVSSREDGAAVAGVALEVTDAAGGALAAAHSDAAGQAELEVPAGVALVVAAESPLGPASTARAQVRPIEAGRRRDVHVRVATQPELVLHLRVVAQESGAPLPDATIGEPGAERARTDPAGLARLLLPAGETFALPVTSPGRERVRVVPARGHETPERALEVALARTAALDVLLLDAGGAPLAACDVLLVTEGYRVVRPYGAYVPGDDLRWRARTDAAGRARLEELPPAVPLVAEAREDGEWLWSARQPLVLEAGERRAVEWRVGAGCRVEGLVREADGRPAGGVELALQAAWSAGDAMLQRYQRDEWRTVESDAAGRFALDGVDVGSWWLGPTPEQGDVAPLARLVEVAAGEELVRVELELSRGLRIEGRVLGPDGAAPGGGHVSARALVGGAWSSAPLEADGAFRLGPLGPGAHELVARAFAEHAPSAPLVVEAGAREVELRLAPGCALEGRVVEADGGAPRAAKIVLSGSAQEGLRMWSTEGSGAFHTDGLPAGVYHLAATTDDGRVGTLEGVRLAPGEPRRGLQVAVRPGARLRLRYLGPRPVGQVTVLQRGVAVAADGIEAGLVRELAVPAGPAVVRMALHPGPELFELALDLAPGAQAEAVFDGGWR